MKALFAAILDDATSNPPEVRLASTYSSRVRLRLVVPFSTAPRVYSFQPSGFRVTSLTRILGFNVLAVSQDLEFKASGLVLLRSWDGSLIKWYA